MKRIIGIVLATLWTGCGWGENVGIFVGPGATGVGTARWLQLAATMPEVVVVCVEDAESLKGLDLLIVPEGDAAKMAAAFGADGVARLRAFAERGGGLIGSGTGARLLLRGDGGFGLVPYAARKPEVPRNPTPVSTAFTAAAASRIGVKEGKRRVWYGCGPCLVPDGKDAAFETLATFRGDVNPVRAESAPPMTGAASLVAGAVGKGRVVAIADNPEYDVATFDIVRGVLGYALGREVGGLRASRRQRGQLAAGFYCGGMIGAAAARAFVELVKSGVADIELIDANRMAEGRLRHLDALVVPAGVTVEGPQAEEFRGRGGRLLAPSEAVAALRKATPARPPVVRAAVYADWGVSCAEFWNVSKLLACSPNYDVTFVDRADIANNVVNARDFDLLLLSGGPIGVQERVVGASGRAAVTNFVRQGGALYGICAGTFSLLQTQDAKNPRFAVVPFRDMRGQPYRGWSDMTMRFTSDAERLLGIPNETRRSILYWGGPVMVPSEVPADSDIRVLATYEGNVVNTFAGGKIHPMSGCASIVGGRFGKGRVLASAIHPECSEATRDLVCTFLKYLTRREAKPVYPVHEPGAVKVAFSVDTATKAGLAFGMSLVRDTRFDVRPTDSYEVNQGILDNTDVLFFAWPVKQGYMGLVHDFIARGGMVVELDPEGKGKVRGERVFHAKTFDEARRIMLSGR